MHLQYAGGLLSYNIHATNGIYICFVVNKLKFLEIRNFCSEILRKALFLESHRSFLRIGEPVLIGLIVYLMCS